MQIDRDGRWTLKRGRKRETSTDRTPGGHKRQPEIGVPMFGYIDQLAPPLLMRPILPLGSILCCRFLAPISTRRPGSRTSPPFATLGGQNDRTKERLTRDEVERIWL